MGSQKDLELSKIIAHVRGLMPEWETQSSPFCGDMNSRHCLVNGKDYRISEGVFYFTSPNGIYVTVGSWTSRSHGHISSSREESRIEVEQVNDDDGVRLSTPIVLFRHDCSSGLGIVASAPWDSPQNRFRRIAEPATRITFSFSPPLSFAKINFSFPQQPS